MATLYELKVGLATIGEQLAKVNDELMAKAKDPKATSEEIANLKQQKADLQERFNILKAEHDEVEAREQAKFKQRKTAIESAKDDTTRLVAAKAEFIRAAVLKRPVSQNALEVMAEGAPLQALPAEGGTGGENFLPTTLSRELLHEPFVKNPLRGNIRLTAIKGLEVPKIAFTLDDNDNFIVDANTAKELNASGDKVTFGRYKWKVKVRISDTVLHGSDLDLVSYVENALRSGLAAKEKVSAFSTDANADPDDAHMTFYEEATPGVYAITAKTGKTMFEAITAAIADLHEDYRENAKVCMAYADYVTMLKELSNNSMTLYSAQPEQIIGKPAIFCDSATIPIVGDFNYYQINYDGAPIYDADKDVNKGEYIFVLTGWFDCHKLLKSAFRLAVVEPEGEGE